MLLQHIALVSDTDEVDASELTLVAAALQTQVNRDLGPIWSVGGTVAAFPALEDVPAGFWPIIVAGHGSFANGDIHVDGDGNPYAVVAVSQRWSLDASRVCLELLVNPFCDRTVNAPSPRADQGRAEFLVDVAGTCGDAAYAYAIHDVMVSDFCMPEYFQEAPASSASRYSLNGSIHAPFALLPRGRITWYDCTSRSWWSRHHWGDAPADTQLGAVIGGANAIRQALPKPRIPALIDGSGLQAQIDARREASMRAARTRALRLRALIHDSAPNPTDQPAAGRKPQPGSPPPLPPRSSSQPTERDEHSSSIAPVSLSVEPTLRLPRRVNKQALVACLGLLAFALVIGITRLVQNRSVDDDRPELDATSAIEPAIEPAGDRSHDAVQTTPLVDQLETPAQAPPAWSIPEARSAEPNPVSERKPARVKHRAHVTDTAPPEPMPSRPVTAKAPSLDDLIGTRL